MKRYKVGFWHYTDLRAEWEGEAVNEIFALTKAYEEKINLPTNNQTGFWSDFNKGFKVTVERVA